MRFVPDGPAIRNNLLSEWRDGKVLFLAGAGVSKPAGLPLFDGLALEVYKHLNDALFRVLSSRGAASDQISSRQRVEAELYKEKQLDRLFAAMEARLDQDARGLLIERKVRTGLEVVLRRATTFAQGHADLLRLSVPPGIPNAATGAICRIATTNFDLLFEAAWKAELNSEPISYDARIAPRPGSQEFAGIIHLHGMLNPDQSAPGQFVLTSRDFARVYLRSGVVANYIYDLIRRYRIILVGYSVDDPPMRYLMDAIGEDASLFEDMKHPYVLTDHNLQADASGELTEARWRAKNINPILFTLRSGADPFAPLWESLRAWADWARDGETWVIRRLSEEMQTPYDASSAFSSSFVRDLFVLLSPDERERTIRALQVRNLDFGWIEALDEALRTGVA
jgi:hypothetical protein